VFPETIGFSRRSLPHWEVAGARYFVTVRCAGLLPRDVRERLAEIELSLRQIKAHSAAFVALQRRFFATLEAYDDGNGRGPLQDGPSAECVVSELQNLREIGIAVPHYSVMPTHWHALLVPLADNVPPLSTVMKRIKGRMAHQIRRIAGGTGPVWQREWFDRWVRDDAEWQRFVDYIRANPVKAGLASEWSRHRWTT
jgi:REP element-mobilizing transposase RayT